MSAQRLDYPPTEDEAAFAASLADATSDVPWGVEVEKPGKHERSWLMPCSQCGTPYEVSDRTRRQLAQRGQKPVCSHCRRPARVRVTLTLRRFWTRPYSENGQVIHNGFTQSELVDLAEAIWGPRDTWT